MDLNIDQAGDSLYITNARTLTNRCNNVTHNFSMIDVGSVELKMTCGCSFVIDGVHITPPLHCSKDEFRIHVSIPNVWSKVEDGVMGNLFLNHNSIFKKNWTR